MNFLFLMNFLCFAQMCEKQCWKQVLWIQIQFWPNLDPDPWLYTGNKFWKKQNKSFGGNNFL